jgi:hypothetical protein
MRSEFLSSIENYKPLFLRLRDKKKRKVKKIHAQGCRFMAQEMNRRV